MFTASSKPPRARTHSDDMASKVKETCHVLAENELVHLPQDDTPTQSETNADDSKGVPEVRVDTCKLPRSVSSTNISTLSELDPEFPLASVDAVWASHRPHFKTRGNSIRNARFDYWVEQDNYDQFLSLKSLPHSLMNEPYIREARICRTRH